MRDLQHNVISVLYSIKGLIEVYFDKQAGHAEENSRAGDMTAERVCGCDAGELLRRIYSQTDRALQMTQRIRVAMKMGENVNERLVPVSVRNSWQEVVAAMRKQYCLNGELEFLSHIPDDFPDILCQRQEFTEILYCLADNAVHAMKTEKSFVGKCPAGKLIIRASLSSAAGGDPFANIVIADTGPGISEVMLNRLFEPFTSTKPLGEGNGFGLCIVKGLVRKNGGSITVSSFPGCGTTFSLSFSVAKSGRREYEKQLLCQE